MIDYFKNFSAGYYISCTAFYFFPIWVLLIVILFLIYYFRRSDAIK